MRPILKLVKSNSLQSYFQKEVPFSTKPSDNSQIRPLASDPSRPICDGRLDDCDRESANDISWSTAVSPTHGPMKKRKSPAGKNGMDVWSHVGRIRADLHHKYARRNANLLPYTHACFHCGSTLALGWSKKDVSGDRLREGCWQTTVVHRHLRVCNMLPTGALAQMTEYNDEVQKIKLEKGVRRNSKVAMPIKMPGGEVVFSTSLDADIRQAAKVAIARTVMYSQTQLPDHYLDCPFEKDKQRLLYKAGFEDAMMGKTDSSNFPTLGSRAVSDYVESEDAIQRAYGRVWATKLDEAASGNPHSQVQSDLVTLSDHGKWQSIGHTDVCPISGIPFTVNTGFRHVADKKNETSAVDMEEQSQRFFGRKQLAVAHSIVTDVGAFGVGAEVVREYPFGTQLHRDKCMMHQMSKVIGYGAMSYGYKDGKGGTLHHCAQIASFNEDFRSLEICFRRQDNAELLSSIARELGMANLRCKTQFNVTRCAGEMHQHTWAIRMCRAIRLIEFKYPNRCQHNFKGNRWQELVEIHALEELAGGLTMKCQTENVATAGYWFHWLDNAFGVLAGRLPMSVVDVDNIAKSPTLPMILRDPDHFLPLPTLVRERHQVEFKRRFGLLGDRTGFDVDSEWKPTMTPAYGLPILLDPRLNNVTTKFGLSTSKKEEYELLLHNMHYEWYLRARQVKVNEQRCEHEAELRLMVLEADILAREKRQDDPLTPEADDDMGWDNPVPALHVARRVIAEPPVPPNIPLISAECYYEISKIQYKAYVDACRNVVPWRNLYPDEKFSIGEKGILWQDKLSTVNLAPVWSLLEAYNKEGCRYGYMLELAKHSKANVYKLQASSFVERVNSAGKIVLNETNVKLKEDKVEKRVMLRMNRKWMCHMKSTYDIDEEMMILLRASHDALAVTLDDNQTRAVPLQMSVDDARLSPQHGVSE